VFFEKDLFEKKKFFEKNSSGLFQSWIPGTRPGTTPGIPSKDKSLNEVSLERSESTELTTIISPLRLSLL
jgi:hypothetical protein